MHTKILSVLYFVAGYFSAFALFWNGALHLRCIGCFLGIYMTYQLVEYIER